MRSLIAIVTSLMLVLSGVAAHASAPPGQARGDAVTHAAHAHHMDHATTALPGHGDCQPDMADCDHAANGCALGKCAAACGFTPSLTAILGSTTSHERKQPDETPALRGGATTFDPPPPRS